MDMQKKRENWRTFHESVSDTLICPSSGTLPGGAIPYNDGDDGGSPMMLGHLSKGNYAACFGSHNMGYASFKSSLFTPGPPPEGLVGGQVQTLGAPAGMFGMVPIKKNPVQKRVGKGIKLARVEDGQSNTVMLSEVMTWNDTNREGASTIDPTVPDGNDDWRGRLDDSWHGSQCFFGPVSAEFKCRGSNSGLRDWPGSGSPRTAVHRGCRKRQHLRRGTKCASRWGQRMHG